MMSVAIGAFIREKLSTGAAIIPVVFSSMSRYLLHGVPEIIAYLFAGLAGGLLYQAIIHKRYSSKVFSDILFLFGIGVVVVLFAGLVEVYVTPLVI